MKNLMKSFAADERGVTSIEYAIIASGVAVAIIASVNALGGAVTAVFNDVVGQLGA